jgi:hypothetical protein
VVAARDFVAVKRAIREWNASVWTHIAQSKNLAIRPPTKQDGFTQKNSARHLSRPQSETRHSIVPDVTQKKLFVSQDAASLLSNAILQGAHGKRKHG